MATPPARTAGQRPLIAVVAAVVLGLGVTSFADATRDGSGEAGTTADAVSPPPAAEPGRTAEVVGPAAGADVTAYVDDRTAALLDAPPEVDTAVVSFDDVLRVDDAQAVVGAGGSIRAVLYRVPLPSADPASLVVAPDADLVAALQGALEGAIAQLREERDAANELLDSGTVDDDEFVAEYQRRVAELDTAIGAVESGRVVHAVVVRADLAQLQALADGVAVRLVDPAPPGTDVSLSRFHGLLPGDTDTVSAGRPA